MSNVSDFYPINIDAESPIYNVPDSQYFKMVIALQSDKQNYVESYTESDIQVYFYNNSVYYDEMTHVNPDCLYVAEFRIDGVDQTAHSGQVNKSNLSRKNPLSKVWSVTDLPIYHSLDGTRTVIFEAHVTIYDGLTTSDPVLFDTDWMSWMVILPTIVAPNGIKDISASVQYVTERSVAIDLRANDVCTDRDNDVMHGDTYLGAHHTAPYPLPAGYQYLFRNHWWHWWYYSLDGGESWTDVHLEVQPTFKAEDLGIYVTQPFPGFEYICWYSEWHCTIQNLAPNTTYEILFAVHSPMTSENEPEYPGLPDGLRREWEYKTITIKTEKVPEPLPLNPNNTGLSRRIVLYEQDEYQFTSNGIGSLTEAFSCNVTEEINGMFEMELEYPVDGRYSKDITVGRIITANPNQYTSPQPFRIYAISKTHDGRITVNAAHISYDLSGITVSPFIAGSVQAILAKFAYGSGTAADVFHRFRFWTDVYAYYETSVKTPSTVRSLLGDQGPILGAVYGEYEFDIFNVKFWARRGVDRGVTISYGKNLTSLKQDVNGDNMYTGVRSFWYKESTDSEPGGLVTCGIVEVTNSCQYTKILALDLTSEFEEKPTEDELYTMTQRYILDNALNKPIESLSVSFVHLSDSLEYKDIKILEDIKLGDYVTILYPKLNVRTKVECVKTVFNVLSQRYDSIDLGVPRANLATTVSNNSKASNNSVSKSELQDYVNNNQNQNGIDKSERYLITDYSIDPPRYLVMDAPTMPQAKYVWKWDFNGLSHSSSGVDGPYTNVMPMSGGVDAASLRRNQINGNMIKEATLSRGNMSESYEDYIINLLATWHEKICEEMKFSDGAYKNVNEPLFTNELVVGKVKLVPVSGGADLILFN